MEVDERDVGDARSGSVGQTAPVIRRDPCIGLMTLDLSTSDRSYRNVFRANLDWTGLVQGQHDGSSASPAVDTVLTHEQIHRHLVLVDLDIGCGCDSGQE